MVFRCFWNDLQSQHNYACISLHYSPVDFRSYSYDILASCVWYLIIWKHSVATIRSMWLDLILIYHTIAQAFTHDVTLFPKWLYWRVLNRHLFCFWMKLIYSVNFSLLLPLSTFCILQNWNLREHFFNPYKIWLFNKIAKEDAD